MNGSLIQPQAVRQALSGGRFEVCAERWLSEAEDLLTQRSHGDRDRWLDVIANLPLCQIDDVHLNLDAVTASSTCSFDQAVLAQLERCLRRLHPWRKGPFNIFGIEIDSEWRSSMKWSRIITGISPLKNRYVLDVGCGNGYYLFRMLGEGARLALGIDPTQLFLAQFAAINHYVEQKYALILPMRSEDLIMKEGVEGFDTVFSMGVYYHRRNPAAHLKELHAFLRPAGELVLETLVLPGHDNLLIPEGRYAQMRNVWQIPTVDRLADQLKLNGFSEVSLIDLTATGLSEQRRTDWMTFDSLTNFLDPDNRQLTIEGYPAPLRATLRATRTK